MKGAWQARSINTIYVLNFIGVALSWRCSDRLRLENQVSLRMPTNSEGRSRSGVSSR